MKRWLIHFAERTFVRALRAVFLSLYVKTYLLEKQMTEKNECKHENAKGKKFCPDCGTQVQEDEAVKGLLAKIREQVESVLDERGVKKPEAPGKKTQTELDRILGKKD